MNKRLLVAAITLGLLATGATPAHAAVKAGAKCTSAKAKIVVGGLTYICVKSGKKLIWSSGVLSKKTSSNSRPQSSPNEIEEPLAPTGFENLHERYKGIPAKIWKNSRDLISSAS